MTDLLGRGLKVLRSRVQKRVYSRVFPKDIGVLGLIRKVRTRWGSRVKEEE